MVVHTKFQLSAAQLKKIKDGITNKESITFRLNKNKSSPTGIDLILTNTESNLLDDGMNHSIEFPLTRLIKIGRKLQKDVKSGGILPLLPLIGIIAAALGATGAAATTAAGIASTVKSAKDIENEKRKADAYIAAAANRGKGAYLASGKKGKGPYLSKQ